MEKRKTVDGRPDPRVQEHRLIYTPRARPRHQTTKPYRLQEHTIYNQPSPPPQSKQTHGAVIILVFIKTKARDLLRCCARRAMARLYGGGKQIDIFYAVNWRASPTRLGWSALRFALYIQRRGEYGKIGLRWSWK